MLTYKQEFRAAAVVGDPHRADLTVRPGLADDPAHNFCAIADLVWRPGISPTSERGSRPAHIDVHPGISARNEDLFRTRPIPRQEAEQGSKLVRAVIAGLANDCRYLLVLLQPLWKVQIYCDLHDISHRKIERRTDDSLINRTAAGKVA